VAGGGAGVRDGAVLSHRSAAALGQLAERERAQPEVTVRQRRRTPGSRCIAGPAPAGR
jgi:hypothetical protein